MFNNAGVSFGGKAGSIPLEDWRWVVDINLMGVVHGVETFTPLIKAHGEGGHIVNTASMAGHWASSDMGPYNATKFAVVGYSETLRQELAGDGIGVSVLCPAWVKTNIHQAHRNRPSRSKADAGNLFAHSDAFKAATAAVENEIDPDMVGGWVADCVEANRFYIFTHPEMQPIIDVRSNMITTDYAACIEDGRFAGQENG